MNTADAIRTIQRERGWNDSTLLYLVLDSGCADQRALDRVEAAAKVEDESRRTFVPKPEPTPKPFGAVARPDSFDLETLPRPRSRR